MAEREYSESEQEKECSYSESNFLEDILSPGICGSRLTSEKLLVLETELFVKYTFIILSVLHNIASVIKDITLEPLLNAFGFRVTTSRLIKTRVILLSRVADLQILERFNIKVLYEPDCYERDISNFNINSESPKYSICGGSIGGSEEADILLKNDTFLEEYAQKRFFNETNGICLKKKRKNLVTYENAFSEYSALLFLMQDLSLEKTMASSIGSRMVELGLIKMVSHYSVQAFGFGRNVFVRSRKLKTSCSNRSILYDKNIKFVLGYDLFDLQTLKFWGSFLWEKPLVEGSDFGDYAITHPMLARSSNIIESDSTLSYGGNIVHKVKVKKVFSSMAKPGILSLIAYSPNCILLPVPEKPSYLEFEPLLIAKAGDNLMDDMTVELTFLIFNHIWRQDNERFGGVDKVPFCITYDVLPTGDRTGLMEFVKGAKPLNDYDWKSWVEDNKHNSDTLDTMLRSAAGSSVGAYVLGCGDRHWDNILIKDGHSLFHIDFGMILGENPAFKTPLFSISKDMENAFAEVGIWESFIDLCGEAFLALRERSSELTRLIALSLQLAGRPQTHILKYLASKESFNILENDKDIVKKFVCDQVRSSSKDWETVLRKFTHDKVDPIFFKVVEALPSRLVSRFEAMYYKLS